jgi:hypothetical protein
MPMMDVRKVGMGVDQIFMVMDVRMRLARWIAWLVEMLMVLVVPVKMFMSHCLVVVRVSMALG